MDAIFFFLGFFNATTCIQSQKTYQLIYHKFYRNLFLRKRYKTFASFTNIPRFPILRLFIFYQNRYHGSINRTAYSQFQEFPFRTIDNATRYTITRNKETEDGKNRVIARVE